MRPDQEEFIHRFNLISLEVHATAQDKGWWELREKLVKVAGTYSKELEDFAKKTIGALGVALEHSELSEGLQGMREDLMDDKIPEFTMEEAEAADTIIRIMDRAVNRRLKVAEAIVAKMEMNKTRPHLHGGKKF